MIRGERQLVSETELSELKRRLEAAKHRLSSPRVLGTIEMPGFAGDASTVVVLTDEAGEIKLEPIAWGEFSAQAFQEPQDKGTPDSAQLPRFSIESYIRDAGFWQLNTLPLAVLSQRDYYFVGPEDRQAQEMARDPKAYIAKHASLLISQGTIHTQHLGRREPNEDLPMDAFAPTSLENLVSTLEAYQRPDLKRE